MQDAKVRLYVDHALAEGQPVPLTQEQAHYLFNVMRLQPGAGVLLFNGRNGEYRARVAEVGKRGGVLICEALTQPLRPPPDLWLLFAPIKKARTDFVVEKAVELGVARILPVQTAHTNAERIRPEKLRAHAVEAAEQCGATQVPEVADLRSLDRVLADWPADRPILWADEGMAGSLADFERLRDGARAGWALLVGPEGGFSQDERARLRARPEVVPVSLGPRILRADTAAVALITLWQATLGDWRSP
jgi:16S rRNA (uracil1498-N3)-methyltransferase